MKQNQREEKQPQWQFNLRRISTSRAEILDLNKSKNTEKSGQRQNGYTYKSFDDYLGTLRREKCKMTTEKQNELQNLASINLIRKPLLENLTASEKLSEFDDFSSSEMSVKSDEDMNVCGDEKTTDYGIDFDVNISLVDQINAIKNKLQDLKCPNKAIQNKDKGSESSEPVKSKIESGILKANAKSTKLINVSIQFYCS